MEKEKLDAIFNPDNYNLPDFPTTKSASTPPERHGFNVASEENVKRLKERVESLQTKLHEQGIILAQINKRSENIEKMVATIGQMLQRGGVGQQKISLDPRALRMHGQ